MPAIVVLGAQWGDEGKGKATDLLATSETIDFVVRTSGGHNAGIASDPARADRSYQVATRAHGKPYVDPEAWAERTPRQRGSWWPQWQRWLAERSGVPCAPPPLADGLEAAPGRYVLQR